MIILHIVEIETDHHESPIEQIKLDNISDTSDYQLQK